MTTYFENLTIGLHVLYILNTHVKFRVNWMLFTISSINLFLYIILNYKNLKFKYLIDDIDIDILFLANLVSMKDIRKKKKSNGGLIKIHNQ